MEFLSSITGTGSAKFESRNRQVLLCLAIVLLSSCEKSESPVDAVDAALAETMSAMHSAMRDVSGREAGCRLRTHDDSSSPGRDRDGKGRTSIWS
jgi:hypothetical protein